MNTADKLHKLYKNDITVYPVISKNRPFRMAVQIKDERNAIYKKKINTGEYKHTTKTINEAINKTINFLIEKL